MKTGKFAGCTFGCGVVGQGVSICELFAGRFESRQAGHICKMSKP